VKAIRLRDLPAGPTTVEGELEWAEIIRQVIRKPLDPQKGVEIDEMRKSIRVLDALAKSNGVLELEDADWEHLKTKTLAMQWGVIDSRIVQFVDEVVMATESPGI
jgi:hypothetical protein